MEDCVKEGLTKNIGLSNFNISQIKDILKQAEIKPAALQVLILTSTIIFFYEGNNNNRVYY